MPHISIFNGQQPANAAEAKKILQACYDSVYADFKDVKIDQSNADKIKADLEMRIINSHIEFLLLKGDEKQKIQQRYLHTLWHSDKKPQFTQSMLFIEGVLGNAHCFKLVDICCKKVEDARKHNLDPYSDNIDIKEDVDDKKIHEFVQTIVLRSVSAPTYSERFFYKSLLNAMVNAGIHVDGLKQSTSSVLTLAAIMAPLAGSAYFIGFFAKEIIVGIIAAKMMKYSSSKLNASEGESNHELAVKVKKLSDSLLYLVGSVPMAIVSGNFALAHGLTNGVSTSIQYITGNGNQSAADIEAQIKILHLRLIAAPLEDYIATQSAQIAAGLREGSSKSMLMKSALTDIREISDKNLSLIEKLDKVEAILSYLSSNPVIHTSGKHAREAIELAGQELEKAKKSLISTDARQYYEIYNRILSPLEGYLKKYNDQWIASYRRNTNAAKLIKSSVATVHDLDMRSDMVNARKLSQMSEELRELQRKATNEKVDHSAMTAINQALDVLPAVSRSGPAFSRAHEEVD